MTLPPVENARPVAPSVIPGVERTLVAHQNPAKRNRLYREAMEFIREQGALAIDVETTGLRVWSQDRVVGIAVYAPSRSFYFPFRHGRGERLNLDPMLIRQDFGPILANPDVTKINFNCKFDQEALYQDTGEIWAGPVYDAALSSHLLSENEPVRTLKGLSDKYLQAGASDAETQLQQYIAQIMGFSTKNKAYLWYLSPEDVSDYACVDVELAWSLLQFHLPYLADHGLTEIFMQVCEYAQMVTEMECYGALIDTDIVARRRAEAVVQYDAKLAELRQRLGRPDFNPNSAPQCSAAFGLIDGKTGRPSTRVAVIEERLSKGPWDKADDANLLIEVKKWDRAIGSYYDKYVELMEPKPISPWDKNLHILHCSFRMASVISGRLACSEPNLQAVPRQSDIYHVKDVFVPRMGYVLAEIDYAQAELRMLAHEANIQKMADVLNGGGDLHGSTAEEMTRIRGQEVIRDTAKRLNFGVVYGLGVAGLSTQVHISEEEAAPFHAAYHALYPEIREFSGMLTNMANANGMIRMWTGRERHYNGWCDCGTRGCREEHKAMSNYIQGGVAEMIRIAMVYVWKTFRQYDVRPILQVHDSLLLEVPWTSDEEAQGLILAICEAMTKGPDDLFVRQFYRCPPAVDAKWSSESWGMTKKLESIQVTSEINNPLSGGVTDWTGQSLVGVR